MEANEEVADQVTEEDAEEMRNRPEIQARELNEEEREEFEDEYKSNDTYRNEYGWQSILSKQYGTGMTSMAGFSPAIHNITHGSKEEPCCDECEDKTTSCGCE